MIIGLAVVLGTGAGGATLLLVFAASASALTRFRSADKPPDEREHAPGSGGRNGRQVWANAGVAGVCALVALVPGAGWMAAGTAGALAASLGRPRAARAVANAVGRNPIAYLIPCHRVLRANGALGGYRWGTIRKQALLARELAQSADVEATRGR